MTMPSQNIHTANRVFAQVRGVPLSSHCRSFLHQGGNLLNQRTISLDDLGWTMLQRAHQVFP